MQTSINPAGQAAAPTAGQWEYKDDEISLSTVFLGSVLAKRAGKLSQEGWELVSTFTHDTKLVGIYKRRTAG